MILPEQYKQFLLKCTGDHTFYGISISTDLYAQVFMWMPEYPAYEDAHLIADSFDEFIELIGSKSVNDFDKAGKLIA